VRKLWYKSRRASIAVTTGSQSRGVRRIGSAWIRVLFGGQGSSSFFSNRLYQLLPPRAALYRSKNNPPALRSSRCRRLSIMSCSNFRVCSSSSLRRFCSSSRMRRRNSATSSEPSYESIMVKFSPQSAVVGDQLYDGASRQSCAAGGYRGLKSHGLKA